MVAVREIFKRKPRKERQGVTYPPPRDDEDVEVWVRPKNAKFQYVFNTKTGTFDDHVRPSYKNKRRAKNRVAAASRRANRRG